MSLGAAFTTTTKKKIFTTCYSPFLKVFVSNVNERVIVTNLLAADDHEFLPEQAGAGEVVSVGFEEDKGRFLAILYKRRLCIFSFSSTDKRFRVMRSYETPQPSSVFRACAFYKNGTHVCAVNTNGLVCYNLSSDEHVALFESRIRCSTGYLSVCEDEKGKCENKEGEKNRGNPVFLWGSHDSGEMTIFTVDKVFTHRRAISDICGLRGLFYDDINCTFVGLFESVGNRVKVGNVGVGLLGSGGTAVSGSINDVVGAMRSIRSKRKINENGDSGGEAEEESAADDNGAMDIINVKIGGGSNSGGGGLLDTLKNVESISTYGGTSTGTGFITDRKSILPANTAFAHIARFTVGIDGKVNTVRVSCLTGVDGCVVGGALCEEKVLIGLEDGGVLTEAGEVVIEKSLTSECLISLCLDAQLGRLIAFRGEKVVEEEGVAGEYRPPISMGRKVQLVRVGMVGAAIDLSVREELEEEEEEEEEEGDDDDKDQDQDENKYKDKYEEGKEERGQRKELKLKNKLEGKEEEEEEDKKEKPGPTTPMNLSDFFADDALNVGESESEEGETVEKASAICSQCAMIEGKIHDIEIINTQFTNILLVTEKRIKRIEKFCVAIIWLLLFVIYKLQDKGGGESNKVGGEL